jgi:hypothetical protein
MKLTRPARFGLSLFATACWWSYALLESLPLHAPLRGLGALAFVCALSSVRHEGRWAWRAFLRDDAIVVAPFLWLTTSVSILAYLGPLALPPEPTGAVRVVLEAKLYASFAGWMVASALIVGAMVMRWGQGRRTAARRGG